MVGQVSVETLDFYPRPPGGGRLQNIKIFFRKNKISIHALRVEGDGIAHGLWRMICRISIHALRVEGDAEALNPTSFPSIYFYPRPPGGGRRFRVCRTFVCVEFLSTPSGWRATGGLPPCQWQLRFLSTPSGWRATAKTDKVFVCFCAKGRRICLFKTRKEKICRWRFKKDKFWVLIWCEGSGKSVCASASHCG